MKLCIGKLLEQAQKDIFEIKINLRCADFEDDIIVATGTRQEITDLVNLLSKGDEVINQDSPVYKH